MKTVINYFFLGVFLFAILGVLYVHFILAPSVDKDLNQVVARGSEKVSEDAKSLHQNMLVTDLHIDSLLWQRDLEVFNNYGQADLPRLQKGGVDIQVFSAVTKSPRGLNFDGNDADAPDDITLLAIAQLWPMRTWFSIYERAAYQAQRLHKLAENSNNKLVIAKRKSDLQQAPNTLVGILLTEGAHPLEGDLAKVQKLFDEGYRAMGLQHFFDNELGGSMHGRSQAGLTELGKAAVQEMERLNILIDVAHSSTQTVKDVLAITQKPIFISHGGTISHCPKTANRNLPDNILKEIAGRGGIIGIGFFDGAICDISPKGVAAAIAHAVKLLGEDAVALGSDFDGSVTTAFDTSQLVLITHALNEQGIPEQTIRKVMGINAKRYFAAYLPH